jgi:N-methylhydantoinase A
VINASLVPLFNDYMCRLEAQLVIPCGGILLVMQSNGGVIDGEWARKRPVYVIESGPAAGVLAAARLAEELGIVDALSFDMGGTTAKACLIEDGAPAEKAGMEIGGQTTRRALLFGSDGHAVRVPTLDIVEVGTGGGSVAWVDPGGLLRVGPRSAGADPGPCCYGRGGTEPTWTDANVVLGFLNSEQIAGGAVEIHAEAARHAIGRVADELRVSPEEAARGIIDISNAMMMRALRAVSVERGRDPRDMVLIAFGGAGPVHAASLAEEMGMRKVLVPAAAGVFSAVGLLLADRRRDLVRSVVQRLDGVDPALVEGEFSSMERQLRQELGLPVEQVQLHRSVDLQYEHTLAELNVPVPRIDSQLQTALRSEFAELHRATFGYVRDLPVQLVNLRVRAVASTDPPKPSELVETDGGREGTKRTKRLVYFHPKQATLTPIVTPGAAPRSIEGPAIIERWNTSISVPPGWKADLGTGKQVYLERVVTRGSSRRTPTPRRHP